MIHKIVVRCFVMLYYTYRYVIMAPERPKSEKVSNNI